MATRRYIPQEIEQKWQARWEEMGLYHTHEDESRPKWYHLIEFPYPSGDLHIGHWYAFAPSDAKARYTRMKGYNVLFPIGFDAFGLPAENAAIKRGIHPYRWTMDNIQNMRRQLKSMGAMFDWSREVITCLPEYYRWTQWFFLQFYKHGLAYRTKAPVDWCPQCNTSLAREQVWGEDRHCERCGTPVVKKELDQWLFRITRYAEELLDFSRLDWPERVTTMQTNWIGRSEGAEIIFTSGAGDNITVFTTRPDTLYGATFLVLAPEHPLVEKLTAAQRRAEVRAYVEASARATEIDRLSAEREKTGVFIGAYARHPLSGEKIPIWIADYVLMAYGTGAIMAVPAHDVRDHAFAQKYGLPIPVVIAPPDWQGEELEEAYTGEGTMVNLGRFDGLPSLEGIAAVAKYLEERGLGKAAVTYRLRDWLISRQRYWGAPIPIVHCPHCGTVPVPEEDLPVLLPEDAEFRPTGESPLKYHQAFVNTTCPHCGGPAQRETDTMDTFVCSSWYQLRYISPHYNAEGPFDPAKAAYWLPVDQYTGGIEHATMHLLYTRFFSKALRDMGIVDYDEPMVRRFSQGIILGEDNEKMSKSRGNVVNPDDYVGKLGADSVRAFLMFLGPWEQGGPWSSTGIEGIYRWLNRAWNLVLEEPTPPGGEPTVEEIAELERLVHQTIRRATDYMENFRFNTTIAALMELTNGLVAAKETAVVKAPEWREALRTLVLLMAPIVPHIAEELWQELAPGAGSVHLQAWPHWDEAKAQEVLVTLVIQVNGRVRDRMEVPAGLPEAEAVEMALARERVGEYLQGKEVQKAIYIPDRLVNIVI